MKRHKIKSSRVLGKGYFGEVREGKWTMSNGERRIAVKSLIPGRMSKEKFLAEANVMKEMQHPNILRILGRSRISRLDSSGFIDNSVFAFLIQFVCV